MIMSNVVVPSCTVIMNPYSALYYEINLKLYNTNCSSFTELEMGGDGRGALHISARVQAKCKFTLY